MSCGQIIEVVQGTPEWLRAKCGVVSASRMADVCGKLKSGKGYLAGRQTLMTEVICERLTGRAVEHFVTEDMKRGIEMEPEARSAYEMKTGILVDQVGFVLHPSIPLCGASPDGFVGDDGLQEIKCPKPVTHMQYILDKVPPAEYQPQMLLQMSCTGRAWCDFVSYCPIFPKQWKLFIVRFHRDEKLIAEIEEEVIKFNAEVDAKLAELESLVIQ